jgi:hypothetical protein
MGNSIFGEKHIKAQTNNKKLKSQHNNTTTQQHNNTTTQQHNNTTTQQHNNTTQYNGKGMGRRLCQRI